MKNLIVLIFLFTSIVLNSQTLEDACFADIDNEIPGRWENPENMYVQYYVNIYFHIIKDDNGDGGVPASRVNDVMSQLNGAFNQHYIYFSNNAPIDYIDNSLWYDKTWGNQSSSLNGNNDGIDIYLYPETDSCSGAAAACVGNANLGIAFLGTLRSTGFKLSEFAAAHEMGHMLGLPHTFEDAWGDEDIDGSNCLTAGDRFCDTPASPARTIALPCAGGLQVLGGLNFEVSPYSACNWLNPAYDVEGQLYQPDVTNYMDYSHPSCYASFSNEQVRAMRAKMERSNIIDEVVCSGIWGTITNSGGSTQPLYTVNFVSSQTIDVDIDAIQTSSFSWDLISSSYVSWVTYNNGKGMSLNLNNGNTASFEVSYDNPCALDSVYYTFIYYGGWYNVYSNPTMDCIDLTTIDAYEIEYRDEKGKTKKLKIDPKIKKIKVLDDSGNIVKNKVYTMKKKYDRICLGEMENGIYYLIINEGEKEMYTERIVKI